MADFDESGDYTCIYITTAGSLRINIYHHATIRNWKIKRFDTHGNPGAFDENRWSLETNKKVLHEINKRFTKYALTNKDRRIY